MSRPLLAGGTSSAFGAVECSISEPFLSSATIREGAAGNHVQSLQWYLKEWGYYTGSLDGEYGPDTREAVKLFQLDAGIGVDGIVGPNTQGALCYYVEYWTANNMDLPPAGSYDGSGSYDGGNGRSGVPGDGGIMPSDPNDRYLLYGVGAAAGVGLAVLLSRKKGN